MKKVTKKVVIGLVSEVGIRGIASSHPTDKDLMVFTNGADHFICGTPIGHEVLKDQMVFRRANEEERKHYRIVCEARVSTINSVVSQASY